MADETRLPLLPKREEIKILKNIAEALNESQHVSSAMDAILPRLSGVLGLTTAWAFRFDPKRLTFVEVGASGLPPALAADDAHPLKTGWCECQDRFVSGRMDRAVNIVRCSRLRDAVGEKGGLRYHASIPLKSKGVALGILNLAATGHQVFTPAALDFLRAIGDQVAVALDRIALISDMTRHNQQLRVLDRIARDLTPTIDPDMLFEKAIGRLVTELGFEAAALVDRSNSAPRLLAQAASPDIAERGEYTYAADDSSQATHHGLLIPEARSAMETAVFDTPWSIRVESTTARAFGTMDEDILSAFSWHLKALLDRAALHRDALEAAKAEERRQLAADLHDSVSQRLFSAQLIAHTALMKLKQVEPPLREVEALGERTERLLEESRLELRTLIGALRPPSRSLQSRLRERLESLQEALGKRLTYTLDAPDTLPTSVEDALASILDEALHNAISHADPGAIQVTLQAFDTGVSLRIRDTGPGFDSTHPPHGLGLETMKERARAQGGSLSIDSTPGIGTVVSVKFPLGGDER